MRFAEYDYQEGNSGCETNEMNAVWDAHWSERVGLKEDLSDEPLWATIRDELTFPGRLLEAGCGTGQWVQFLGKHGHDAVGVDYAASGLKVGQSHNANLHLIQADFRNLPFDDASFDYVVSFGAVEHDVCGPQDALREFCRVLKPQGKLMCSVPCLNLYRTLLYPWLITQRWLKCRKLLRRALGKTSPYVFYEYMWSPSTYRGILNQCGFRVLDVRGYGTVLRSQLAVRCDSVVGRVYALSSAHMMMAICGKR